MRTIKTFGHTPGLRRSYAVCGVLWIIAFLSSLLIGSSDISPWLIIQAALGPLTAIPTPAASGMDDIAVTIFWDVRLPRTLLVALVGGALAASGVLTQGLFRNPLASPSLLSMEAGASLAGTATLFYAPPISQWYTLPVISCLGAWLTTTLMLFAAGKTRGKSHLLLTGVALSAFFSAVTSFLLSFHAHDFQQTSMVMRWLLGGFGGRGLEHLSMILVPLMAGILIVRPFLPALDVMVLGESTASTLGISLARLRWAVVLVVGLWLGGAVAVAGSIPFVGLVVPHMGRKIFGPTTHVLLGGCFLLGMTLTLVADTFGRVVLAPHEVEVGIMMALVGSPIFVWILYQSSSSDS